MTSESLLAKLEREGKLERQRADASQLNDLIEAARRNFTAAQAVQGYVDEAAFKLYYDGLLQVSRVVLLLEGYRPKDGDQHKTTFQAAGEILGNEFEDLIRKLQKFRIKRNDCIYEPKDLVGKSEAEAIHKTARAFWGAVRAHLEKGNPQLKLFSDF